MDRTALIEQIIGIAFKSSIRWEPPTLRQYVGPSVPQFFDGLLAYRDEKIAFARRSLEVLPDAYLQAELQRTKGQHSSSMLPQPRGIKEALDEGRFLRLPPWYAGGFGVEGKEADFDYWAKMNSWTWAETTALAIGFEPMAHVPSFKDDPPISPEVLQFYERYRKLIGNNFFQYWDSTIIKPSPLSFCSWAIKVGLNVPLALLNAVRRVHGIAVEEPATDSPSDIAEPEEMEPRERESLLRLVIGMAKGGYGYDIYAERSSVPTDIKSDLNLIGLDLHLDTIRKYLRAASELVKNIDKAE